MRLCGGFSLFAAFLGALYLINAANSLFPRKPNGKLSALAQRRDFACAKIKKARENLAVLTAAIFCDLRGNPSGFPLSGALFKGTPFFMRAAFTPSVSAHAQIGVRSGKARFSLREKFKINRVPENRSVARYLGALFYMPQIHPLSKSLTAN